MPNWAYTNYVIEGELNQLKTFEAKLNQLNRMPRPLLKNGFGKLWLGNIVHLLGGNWKEIRCRGRILDYYLEYGGLRLSVESAWCEQGEVRHLLLKKFPDIKVYYQTEEPGMEIFQCNDESGKYFTEQYVIDSEETGEEYYEDLTEVARRIQEITGLRTEETETGIRKTIDVWTKEDPDNRWLCFHEFEYVED